MKLPCNGFISSRSILPEISTANKISRPLVGRDTGSPIHTGRAMANNVQSQIILNTNRSRDLRQDDVAVELLLPAALAKSGARRARMRTSAGLRNQR